MSQESQSGSFLLFPRIVDCSHTLQELPITQPKDPYAGWPDPSASEAFIRNADRGAGVTDVVDCGWYNAVRFQAAKPGIVNQVRLRAVLAGAGRTSCAVYADDNGTPGQLLGVTGERDRLGEGWQTFVLCEPVELQEGQFYWLANNRYGQYGIGGTEKENSTWYGRLAYNGDWPDTLPKNEGTTYKYWSICACDGPLPLPEAAANLVATPVSRPVGEKKPNAFGLYDVHGNIWEWVSDWYADLYDCADPCLDPQGPPDPTGTRIYRGGHDFNAPAILRCAFRHGIGWLGFTDSAIGMRVVMEA